MRTRLASLRSTLAFPVILLCLLPVNMTAWQHELGNIIQQMAADAFHTDVVGLHGSMGGWGFRV